MPTTAEPRPERVLRILVLAGAYPVLTQPFISDLAEALHESGQQVTVLAEPGQDVVGRSSAARRALLDRMVRVEARPRGLPARMRRAWALYRSAPSVKRRGLRRVLRPWRGGLRGLLLRDFFQAAAVPPESTFDIVHAHFGVLGVRAAALMDAGLLRGRLVVSFHGHDATRRLTRRRRRRYHRLFRQAALVSAPTRFLARLVEELGCPPQKLVVLPSGIDLPRFPFRVREPPADGPVRLLSVGRLVEPKGHRVAIEALATLVGRSRPLHYAIAGEGPERPRLEACIRELGLEKHVTLLGARSHEEVRDLLQRAHAFLHPSLRGREGNRESLGVAVLEAQACGLPVLASALGGLPEAVPAHTLVPPGDVDALSLRLEELLRAPESWPDRGRAGRALVEAAYDQAAIVQRWIRSYRRLLEQGIQRPE